MTIRYHLDADGGFTVGDDATGRTAYAYPTSSYAVKARRQPAKVAAEMAFHNSTGSHAEYDARNWARLGVHWLPGEQAWHEAWQRRAAADADPHALTPGTATREAV